MEQEIRESIKQLEYEREKYGGLIVGLRRTFAELRKENERLKGESSK